MLRISGWLGACPGALLATTVLLACGEESESKKGAGAFSGSQLAKQHCDTSLEASSYRASLGPVGEASAREGPGPVPCFQLTGFGSAENTLAVASDGTVFVAPVFTSDGNGILSTRDNGQSFQTILPETRGGAVHGRVQPYMFLDPSTDQLLFATASSTGLTGGGFALSVSADLGKTFQARTVGEGTVDWIKMVAAKPVTSNPSGYPNVLYALAPTPISTPVPLINLDPEYQQVQRSRDGGLSWETVGGKQLSLKTADNDCPASEWVIYGGGVGLPDGSIYYGFRRCTRVGIASSRDEGETWTVRDLPGSKLVAYSGILSHINLYNLMVTEPLAADSDGNLYALWVDENDVLRFSVSRDKAETWSSPLAVNAPAAPRAVFGAMAIKEPGVMAIAYYGGDGSDYHAYIAETTDALSERPSFWSQAVSAPLGPLFRGGFDVGYGLDILAGGDLVEITQVKYAPNGDIWAAFVKDMCHGANDEQCDWDRAANTGSVYQGAVGRLVHR